MRLRPRIAVEWFPRRWPYFAIGFDRGEFHLYLTLRYFGQRRSP